jgi:nitrile hydratase subunit beta
MVDISQIMPADGERPLFAAGEQVRVIRRFPIGHYRVPRYIRGKRAIVERVIEPTAVDNEEGGFGRNAGSWCCIHGRRRWARNGRCNCRRVING